MNTGHGRSRPLRIGAVDEWQPERPLPAADVPLPPAAAPQSAAIVELLSLPAAWLASLPAPSTLRIRTDALSWYVSTSGAGYRQLRVERRAVVLLASELAALAYAAECGRASRPWLTQWLAAKRSTPSLQLDRHTACGGVRGDGAAAQPWPLGRVLFAWGSQLEAAVTGDKLVDIDGDARI